MAIFGRTEQECADKFRAHLSKLVASIFGQRPFGMLPAAQGKDSFLVGFRSGQELVRVPIETKFGRLEFYLAQLVLAEEHDGRGTKEAFRLSTSRYWYHLYDSAGLEAKPHLRWEYERHLPEGKLHCRHHLHQHNQMDLGTGCLDLDKAHLPTGWVLLEEVFRFLIVELKMRAHSSDWDQQLRKSERKFHSSFT